MKKAFVVFRRISGILLSTLILLTTGVVCEPIAASGASDVVVHVFQITSRYDMGIDPANVRLGWEIETGIRGFYQSAYRVVVTEAATAATAWDSGWVESSVQIGICTEGLKPETIYTCAVSIKDQNGKEYTSATPATLETAPAELESEWLASKGLLRETFTLEQPLANVERARCYMSSSGIIEVRLNGEKVGDLIWNPKKSVADKVTYYNTYDITAMLRDGANAVGA